METITEQKAKNYSKEKGFDPNTPIEEIVKHYSKIISEKDLDKININHNVTIAIQIPVWPQRYQGRKLSYYKKDGHWKISFMSNVILKQDDKLGYHNLPSREDFLNDDYDNHHNQFLIIRSSDPEKIVPGQIAYMYPNNKNIQYFKFNGETLAVTSTMNFMFSKEV
jgi:hypothetical protein